jgi:glucose/arabinose dehydrogenase
MRKPLLLSSAARVGLAALVAAAVPASSAGQTLSAIQVASGLSNPLGFVQDPSDPTVQVILEQGGRIRVLKNGVLQAADFLNLSGETTGTGEQGLLGLAFSPQYGANGRVFVYFTNLAGHTVVSRFLRMAGDPLRADASTRFDFRWPDGQRVITQPFSNHNGGNMAFGPDGYLYIGLGDGGSGSDPFNFAQNPLSLLGKILRLNVDVPDSDPEGYDVPAGNPFAGRVDVLGEIWTFGLRNPWRWSFDNAARGGTGALVIGDVGQGDWEEIDYQPANAGGRNFGWRVREGAHPHVTSPGPFPETPLIDPILEYSHDVGRSVTGGFVYRGAALGSGYAGRYFFADYAFGRVWSVSLTPGGPSGVVAGSPVEHSAELGSAAARVSSFGEDAGGELYVVSHAGTVYRIALQSVVTGGCIPPDPFAIFGGGSCVNGGWLPPTTTSPPATSSTGCSTPDPFAALGGGTCVNGGWLPPSPSTSSGGSTGCSTPDPFATIGGGTCVNGGWLPPTTAPSPSGSSTGCSTPDPFATIGGGTCVNGGWLPPATAPAPSGSSTGCSTPDPFATMGGGTCVNGGWILSGSAPPPPPSGGSGTTTPPAGGSTGCSTPDPFATMGGGTCVNGGWLPPGMTLPGEGGGGG